MQPVSRGSWRRGIARFFIWLVFTGALLIAPNLLPIANTVRANHFLWLDAFATAALLFGPAILLGSLLGAFLLALLEQAVQGRRSRWLRALPDALTFAIFLVAWLRLFRGTLKFNKIATAWVDRRFEIPLAILIAVLLFALVPTGLSRWVVSTGQRLRPVGWACTAILAALLGYVLFEPFYKGSLGPVQLPEPERQQPNVIVIVLDALTSVDMSVYGYALPTTPRLDEITRTWTVFENAHTAATATTAAQPAILSGRYPFTDDWYRYGDLARSGKGLLNLPRILQASGYETIYAEGGGWSPSRYHLHASFNRIIGAGFPAFQHPRYAVHRFPGHDLVNRTLWDPAIAEALLSWQPGGPRPRPLSYEEPMYDTVKEEFQAQTQTGDTTPFFLYMHAMRPHHPYFAGEFLGTFLPREEGMTTMREQNQQYLRSYKPGEQTLVDKLRLRYDENILKADQELGQVIDTLKQSGLYDTSLIIITADHGTNFTEGNQGYFTQGLWAAEHRVPLLVKFPGQTTGQRIDNAVSIVDILPTVLDVIGAGVSPGWLDGQSLLAAEQSPDRIVYVTRVQPLANLDFSRVAAIQGDLKLVRRGDREALFNLARDPNEMINLNQPATGLHDALTQFTQRAAFLDAGGDIAKAPALAPIHRTSTGPAHTAEP